MATVCSEKIRFECDDDLRLNPAEIRLNRGVLEILCTNPFDTIDLWYTHFDGSVDRVCVTIRDADGEVLKERDFDIHNVDWVVIDAPAGDEPVVNHMPVDLDQYGSFDMDESLDGLQVGLSVRRRASLSHRR